MQPVRHAVIGLLVVFTAISSQAAGLRVLEERYGFIEVEVDFSKTGDSQVPVQTLYADGLPRISYVRFFIALPKPGECSVKVESGDHALKTGDLPPLTRGTDTPGALRAVPPSSGFYPEVPFSVSKPFYYRKVPVVAVDCYSEQVDYSRGVKDVWKKMTLGISYPASGKKVSEAKDPILGRIVLNASRAVDYPKPKRLSGTSPGPHFSLSSNWVKIGIKSRGVYYITGNDLFNLGFPLGAVDPRSFRLFTAGGVNQSLSFADSSGTWIPGNWMRECDIYLLDGGDGSFDPDDRIVFYALDLSDWLDYFDPSAPDTVFYDHPYATTNYYYLTWGGAFAGPAGRMQEKAAAPGGNTPRKTFPERIHFEKNLVRNFDFGGDGWLWLDIGRNGAPNEEKLLPVFTVRDLVETHPQVFRTIAFSSYCGSLCLGDTIDANANHHAVYIINGKIVTEKIWNTSYGTKYEDGYPVSASGFFLQEGQNRFVLRIPRDLNPKDFMYFDYYCLFYERRLSAVADELAFTLPDTSGVLDLEVSGFLGSDSIYVFDVTDQYHPGLLRGLDVSSAGSTRKARFSYASSGGPKHFWACSAGTFKMPYDMKRYTPVDLRGVSSSPNMLIIYHEDMRSAAERLKNFRNSHLPYYQNGDALAVSIESVYDNFSGGVHDPMAIRNYCKFLYDNFTAGGAPLLAYLCLIGDANTDYKRFASVQEDYLPTSLNLHARGTLISEAYATDEWYAYMDPLDETPGFGIPDIAVGRLPAANASEATIFTDKIIAYETTTDFDSWKSRVILVADDEISGTSRNTDDIFILQTELLANYHLPSFIDAFKIYLTEFAAVQGIKPGSRKTFIDQWNKGSLLINYIGHGSSQQMADEQVFLGSDVGSLDNGLRLPLMVAMSCTIGDFDNPAARSLSEKLLLRVEGGAVAVVAASQVTYITPNFGLNYNIFDKVFPLSPGAGIPLGIALNEAKINMLPSPQLFVQENNEKYNLLGDPAMTLNVPKKRVDFLASDVDTIYSGRPKKVRGFVMGASGVDTTFSGSVNLVVRESDDDSGYRRDDGFFIPYRYPGGDIYRGTAQVTRGAFEFDFHVPRYPNPGEFAFIMAYAENGILDAAQARKDVALVYPSASDSDFVDPKDGPPRVNLGFKGGIDKIKPGAILQAVVRDADGIDILSTTNEGKQVLIFDGSNVPVDVTEYFAFDEGGTDTSGVLLYPLPDISVGRHSALYKVADSYGQIALDTLSFDVIDPMENYAEMILNYPNPFEESTHFLLHLSDPAFVVLDIFTSSGRRIRTLKARKDAGEAWIYWDGRDLSNDEIANGLYLFVAKIVFEGGDSPPKFLRGKVVKMK